MIEGFKSVNHKISNVINQIYCKTIFTFKEIILNQTILYLKFISLKSLFRGL